MNKYFSDGRNKDNEMVAKRNNHIDIERFGLIKFVSPITSVYNTVHARQQSYKEKKWPNRVKQMPQDLADAGFYYCGNNCLTHILFFFCLLIYLHII